MDQRTKEKYIYQLVAGKTIVGDYEICNPTPSILYEAELVYDKYIHANRFSGWFTQGNIVVLLQKHGIVSREIDDNLVKINNEIDTLKLNLYKSYDEVVETRFLAMRKHVDNVQEKRNEMYGRRHQWDHLTVEGFADTMKALYIFQHTVKHRNRTVKNYTKLKHIISHYYHQKPTSDQLREIARTEPWVSLWRAKKQNIFRGHLYDQQIALILYSQMYDNIYKHSDCPPDAIINDDYLLDGWMIDQKNKRKARELDKKIDKKVGNKQDGSQEIFIVARNQEEANEIYRRNDAMGRAIIQSRQKTIHDKGEISEANLPDVKREINMQRTQAYIKTMRKE